MRLSYAVFIFLRSVRETPGCTPQQRIVFERYQRRCVEEIQVLADTASRTLDMLPDAPSDDLLDRRKLQWMNWMASFPELKSHQKQHKLRSKNHTSNPPELWGFFEPLTANIQEICSNFQSQWLWDVSSPVPVWVWAWGGDRNTLESGKT